MTEYSIRTVDSDQGPYHQGSSLDRFGGAYPSGRVGLHTWEGKTLVSRTVQCSSYRRAVRLLRMHLKGYNV